MGKKYYRLWLLCTLLVSLSWGVLAQENNPRMLIHILDYLAQDYSGAVSEGKILNPAEYQEQTEFAGTALRIAHHLDETKNNSVLLQDLEVLQKAISNKENPDTVSQIARRIQAQLIQVSKIEIAPHEWPNISKGKILYEQNCVSCHGIKGEGNGPLASKLNPPPTNFWNLKRMPNLSSFQIFNTIRLGIDGTPMMAFQKFSDQEVWNLAFYVQSLRYSDMQHDLTSEVPDLSLEQIASLSDHSIIEKFHLNPEKSSAILASLRFYTPPTDSNTIKIAYDNLNKAQKAYQDGDQSQAKTLALVSYLEGVEPIEQKLRALDSKLVTQIEEKMAELRTLMGQAASYEVVLKKITDVNALLNRAEQILDSSYAQSYWFVFVMAFSIILREGFEAVLILVTILGVVKMLGAKKAVAWAHGGWILALLLGVFAWIFSGWLLGVSGASRESMEGFTSLFAVIVLLYVGFWLHSKSEIGKWTSFIKQQMDSALQGSKLIGIGLISFMAVFREVFETVLFLRALWLEGAASEKTALMMGVLVSFGIIFLLATFLLKWSVKLPIGKLFSISAIVMIVLAVILTGKGLHALQMAGYLPTTLLSIPFKLPLLGFFPSVETILPQLIILVLSVLLWKYGTKSHQKLPA